MSVRNAGNTIREARIKAGLTQEQLSDGVCSLLSLSRIERGTAGVSPSTFQALMAHAGAPCEIFPVFENWNDYECFFHLRHARFHLDAWQLQPAWEELKKVKETEWNHNKYNYQEWLLLHGMLQFRSGKGNHQELYDLFLNAIHISRPDIVLTNFKDLLLSIPEIELLLSLAQEALYLNEAELCVSICSQIQDYLSNSQITFLEKNFLLAEHAVIYTKYLISKEAYECAYQLADTNRHQMVVDGKDSLLFELTFLTGLCEYHLGKHSDALEHFKSSFYSAHAVSSPYATTCRNYMQKHLKLDLPKNMVELPDIPLQKFKMEKIIDTSIFSDGVYSYYNADVITIGRLIHELRIRQNVSQQILCQGLCSISKLSKIESGTLQPSVILSETLLQRLGVSEREFVFWGNAKEAKFYELKFKLLHRLYISKEKGINMLNELQHLITEKDILYKQFYLYMKSQFANSSHEKMSLLKKAFSCTLPNFDVHQIREYRLSWMELTILNNLSYEYRYTPSPYRGIETFNCLLEYRRAVQPDIILQSNTYSITFYEYFYLLYVQKYFKELVDLYECSELSVLTYSIEHLGGVFFYYCQSLGECSQYDHISLLARYSCGIDSIGERPNNPAALMKYLYEDFSIDINY